MFTTLCSDDSTGHKSRKAFTGIEKGKGKKGKVKAKSNSVAKHEIVAVSA